MKKRSMLAIASLATGFVVAAVTPSHGLDADALAKTDALGGLGIQDTLGTLDKTVASDSLAVDENALGGEGGRSSRNG
ncbi:hypothetical protein [Streptomyces sp. NPDC002845]